MMRRALLATLVLALAGCVSGTENTDGGSADAGPEPEWTPIFDELDRVLLSAWGPSLDELWLVGGGLGSPGDALVLSHTAEGWREHATGTTDTFWWVWGTGQDDIFFVGVNGTIAHYDGTVVSAMVSPTSATLYGVWGSGPSDVWAVGGDPLRMGETDVVLHYDGSTWTQVALPDPAGGALFKVWGAAADDVWVVGQGGAMFHYDGAAWAAVDSTVPTTLFTVYGRARDDIWAVGGSPPTLLHYDGSAWTRQENPGLAGTLTGVSVAQNGAVLVVGSNGAKWRRTPEGEWFDEFDVPPYRDLHGAWLSPDGRHGVVVGGNYNSPPASLRVGVVAYHGNQPPTGMIGP